MAGGCLCGVIVSVFVMFAGINIAKDTLEPLMGEAVDKDLYHKVSNFVESYEGIVGSHDLIIHSYGPNHLMGTIHVEVPSNADFEKPRNHRSDRKRHT